MYLRHCVYHSSFLHLLPYSMYHFISDFLKISYSALALYAYKYLSCAHHANEFSTALTAYDTI